MSEYASQFIYQFSKWWLNMKHAYAQHQELRQVWNHLDTLNKNEVDQYVWSPLIIVPLMLIFVT